MTRGRALTALALSALLAAPPAAGASVRAGSLDDRSPVDALPHKDIRAVAVVYDTAGSLRVAVRMGGVVTPRNLSGVEVGLGRFEPARGWCRSMANFSLYPPDPQDPADPSPWGGVGIGGRDLDFDPLVTLARGLFMGRADHPQLASRPWNCARAKSFGPQEERRDYKVFDETDAFPLFAGITDPKRAPRCTLRTRVARPGATAAFRCANAAGPLTVRFYRDNRLGRAKTVTVGARGGAAVSTRGLRRGLYTATAWRGAIMIGQGDLALR